MIILGTDGVALMVFWNGVLGMGLVCIYPRRWYIIIAHETLLLLTVGFVLKLVYLRDWYTDPSPTILRSSCV